MSATGKSTIQAGSGAGEALGQTLGRYQLLEKVGESGCGVVLHGSKELVSWIEVEQKQVSGGDAE